VILFLIVLLLFVCGRLIYLFFSGGVCVGDGLYVHIYLDE